MENFRARPSQTATLPRLTLITGSLRFSATQFSPTILGFVICGKQFLYRTAILHQSSLRKKGKRRKLFYLIYLSSLKRLLFTPLPPNYNSFIKEKAYLCSKSCNELAKMNLKINYTVAISWFVLVGGKETPNLLEFWK